jgi:hypothetical protein
MISLRYGEMRKQLPINRITRKSLALVFRLDEKAISHIVTNQGSTVFAFDDDSSQLDVNAVYDIVIREIPSDVNSVDSAACKAIMLYVDDQSINRRQYSNVDKQNRSAFFGNSRHL